MLLYNLYTEYSRIYSYLLWSALKKYIVYCFKNIPQLKHIECERFWNKTLHEILFGASNNNVTLFVKEAVNWVCIGYRVLKFPQLVHYDTGVDPSATLHAIKHLVTHTDTPKTVTYILQSEKIISFTKVQTCFIGKGVSYSFFFLSKFCLILI